MNPWEEYQDKPKESGPWEEYSAKPWEDFSDKKRVSVNILDEEPTEGTSIWDDFKIAAANAAGTVNQAVGGGLGGAIAVPEQMLTGDVKAATALTDWGSKSKEDLAKWANPENKEQSFAGKAIGMVGTLPAQLVAMPFTPIDSALEAYKRGETIDRSTLIGMEEAAGVMAGVGLPAAIGKTATQKVLTGFGAGAAQDYATRQAQVDTAQQQATKEYFQPTLETTGLAGIVGGGVGSIHALATRGESPTDTKLPAIQDRIEPTMDGVNTRPEVDTPREDVSADLEAKDMYARQKDSAEKQIIREENNIRLLEKRINEEKYNTPEAAAEAKQQIIAEIENSQRVISRMEGTIENAKVMLGEEMPNVIHSRRSPANEAPSSLPPRPDGEFVRQQEAPRSSEEAINAEMFDQQTPVRPQEIASEPSRIDSEQTSQPMNTEVPTRVEEAPREPSFLESQLERTRDAIASLEKEREISQRNENTRGVANEMESAAGRTDYMDRPYNEKSTIDIDNRLHSLRGIEERLTKEVEAERSTPQAEEIEITAPKETGSIEDIEAAVRPAGPQLIGGSKWIRDTTTQWLKKLGLDKENVDLKLGLEYDLENSWIGKTTVHKDSSSTIQVRGAESLQRAIEANSKLKDTVGKLTPEQASKFREAWTAAHEIGHLLLGKLIQNHLYTDSLGLGKLLSDFEAWKAKTTPADQIKSANLLSRPTKNADYYTDFPEFFAQYVAKELVMGRSGTHGAIRDFVNSIRDIWKDALKKTGLDKLLPQTKFMDTFIRDLIAQNKKSLDEAGKNLFEIESVINSKKVSLKEAWDWQNKNLYRKASKDGSVEMPAGRTEEQKQTILAARATIDNVKNVMEAQAREPDINPIAASVTSGLARQLFDKGILKVQNALFGIHQKDQFYQWSPAVKYSTDVILKAVQDQVTNVQNLLSGVPTLEEFRKGIRPGWMSLARRQGEHSVTTVAKNSSNADFAKVFDILDANYGKKSYGKTLEDNRASMTDQQVKLFSALTKMFERMHDLARKSEEELGKTNILPKVEGWYPSHRKQGDYSVNMYQKGLDLVYDKLPDGTTVFSDLIYREQFRTKEEAEAFIARWDSQPNEKKAGISHTGVTEVKESDTMMNQAREEFQKEFMEFIRQQKVKEGADPSKLQDQINWFIARGGTLGSHHKIRTNVAGFQGAEAFKSVGEKGQSFRDAIFSSAEEYSHLIMKMTIDEHLKIISENEDLKKSHPNVVETVDGLRTYALNDDRKAFEMKGAQKFLDSIYVNMWRHSSILQKMNFPQYPTASVLQAFNGKAAHLFYIHALMGRPSFWVSQGMQSMWSLRTFAQEGIGPLSAMDLGGKANLNLIHQPKDFVEFVFWASQNTHTFNPSFISDLNAFHIADFLQAGGKGRLIMDLITGEKQSTAADTFSRMTTASLMFELYKQKGLTGEALYQAAIKATDQNMVQYGMQYKAPIFRKMGLVGDFISPLQTFSTAALGNFIADAKGIFHAPGGKAKLRAMAPMIATTLVTGLMAGAIGVPFVLEYEALRLGFNWLMEKIGLDLSLPSVIDWALQGDNTFANRTLSHGLISSSTYAVSDEGFDFASSSRWQAIYGGALMGEKTFMDLLPVIKFNWDLVGDVGTILSNQAGLEKTEAEIRDAKLGITPGGYKGFTDMFLGYDKKPVVLDMKGNAIAPNTKSETIAKFLGTSTISTQRTKMIMRRLDEAMKRDSAKIAHTKELLADAVFRNDQNGMNRQITKLANKYNVTPQEMFTFLQSEAGRRMVPAIDRMQKPTSSPSAMRRFQKFQDTYAEEPVSEGEQ